MFSTLSLKIDAVSGVIFVENPDVVSRCDSLNEITASSAPSHELEVSVTDGKYSGATLVKVNCAHVDENSALRFAVDRYEASIEENSTRILIVEIVNLLGLELNEHVEFRILNPSELFEIGATSGAIRTRGIPFDREVKDKYEIIVEVRPRYDHLSS
jgi:protocadherin Fat 1/2/3